VFVKVENVGHFMQSEENSRNQLE